MYGDGDHVRLDARVRYTDILHERLRDLFP
jgi:hypothetical protein